MMQSTSPLLSLAIWCPIAFGIFILAFGRDDNPGLVRVASLIGAVTSFLVTLPLIQNFDNAAHGMQFVEKYSWIERFNINYFLGIDGISVWFIVLTAFITVIVVIAGWEVIEKKVAQYMGAFLILSGLMVGVFCALDGLLFYVFFEATLIPMFVIIGVWGGANRVYAAFKFFLYTLMGSLLTLIAVLYLYTKTVLSTVPAAVALATSVRSREPVAPYSIDIPYSKKPDAIAPKMKYFIAASVETL